jgi:hypothetical protein
MLKTKGRSKITAKEVIAARKLKASYPEMSMQAIKDKLHLKIHVIMVCRDSRHHALASRHVRIACAAVRREEDEGKGLGHGARQRSRGRRRCARLRHL